jgi:hypothetical protein
VWNSGIKSCFSVVFVAWDKYKTTFLREQKHIRDGLWPGNPGGVCFLGQRPSLVCFCSLRNLCQHLTSWASENITQFYSNVMVILLRSLLSTVNRDFHSQISRDYNCKPKMGYFLVVRIGKHKQKNRKFYCYHVSDNQQKRITKIIFIFLHVY